MQLKERVILRTSNKTDSMCVRVTAKNQTDIDRSLDVIVRLFRCTISGGICLQGDDKTDRNWDSGNSQIEAELEEICREVF